MTKFTEQYRDENGKLHREDGPAIVTFDGKTKMWYYHGKRHREDGPAVIFSDGRQEWYYNYKNITNKVIQWAKERDIDLDDMSDIDKIALKFSIAGFVK